MIARAGQPYLTLVCHTGRRPSHVVRQLSAPRGWFLRAQRSTARRAMPRCVDANAQAAIPHARTLCTFYVACLMPQAFMPACPTRSAGEIAHVERDYATAAAALRQVSPRGPRGPPSAPCPKLNGARVTCVRRHAAGASPCLLSMPLPPWVAHRLSVSTHAARSAPRGSVSSSGRLSEADVRAKSGMRLAERQFCVGSRCLAARELELLQPDEVSDR